jgi:hypothetical protein
MLKKARIHWIGCGPFLYFTSLEKLKLGINRLGHLIVDRTDA